MDFSWPASHPEIERVQRERKRVAVEQALRAPFHRSRLRDIDLDRLDDPEVWNKIPLLTKEDLRALSAEKFYTDFCLQPLSRVVEYWRSGGVTGRPLFYPRSGFDMKYGLLAFRRAWPLVGATAEDCVHISFPLGIHPVGHLYARTAEELGLGTLWCGSGTNTPSAIQLELIQQLKPTIWAGMASYGLHLANLAEASGFDLASSSVEKLIVAAEPLSPAKRQKLERMWGAEVFDHFGMTEASFVAGECYTHDGLYVWSDLFYVEVIDENSGLPVPEGVIGTLVVTPLWNNTMTPFLRWNSGDLVCLKSTGEADGPWSIFPVMRHARRTVGFFKVRGININHSELEDLMFLEVDVADFKAEADTSSSGLDILRLMIETRRGIDSEPVTRRIGEKISKAFDVTPEIVVLEPGALGREFEASVKAPRFVDMRG
jgi:phenylacetate-CoA ligase